ncbi:MAG: ring-cleaving dioxygenase [Thermoleophilia bacterium]|nr:ring-cleaving dioxygenase [Thermoleophilia bacterium]
MDLPVAPTPTAAPQLDGLHHVTMITGDAQQNADFYEGLLGLRLVKQTVNFDAPDMYHLYFGDDAGSPGSLLTWFEVRGARPGRAGAGMIHRIELGVATRDALDFWAGRLDEAATPTERVADDVLRFRDGDGLEFDLLVAGEHGPRLAASSPDVPAEHAVLGVVGVRAYPVRPAADEALLEETLGFTRVADAGSDDARAFEVGGAGRQVRMTYDPAPSQPGRQGAGTVHHVAWATPDEDQLAWQSRVHDAGAYVTPVQDRDYFDAIYFRMPSGVLFEIATRSPGFATDEEPGELGRELRVPPRFGQHADEIRAILRSLDLPRSRQVRA